MAKSSRNRHRYSEDGIRRAKMVRAFCETRVVLPEAPRPGMHLEFEEWAWENMILPVFGTLRRDGRRQYKRVLWGLPRWHNKSTTAAAIGIEELALHSIPQAISRVVATSLGQADVIHGKARTMASGDDLLRRFLKPTRVGSIRNTETQAILSAIAHNADTAQGFHPPLALIDELHVHRNERMLNAMISGSVGFEEPLVIVITTAGEKRSGVWWEVLRRWRQEAEQPGSEVYVWWCGADDDDDGEDPAVWMKANPASWITEQKIRSQFNAMPFAEFERYHLNRAPKVGPGQAFPPDKWRACDADPIFDPELPCIMAVDASGRGDHTFVVVDQLGRDHVHNLMGFRFTAEEEGGTMSAIDQNLVCDLILQICRDMVVKRVPSDQAFFLPRMHELLARGVPMEAYAQSNDNMSRACQRMFNVIVEGRIRHGGDPELTEHVLNAAVKTVSQERGWRIIKNSEEDKIDGATACAMAIDVAEAEWEDTGPLVVVG